MNDRILIMGAKIVNEGTIVEANVLIEDGKISEIFSEDTQGDLFSDIEDIHLLDGRGNT